MLLLIFSSLTEEDLFLLFSIAFSGFGALLAADELFVFGALLTEELFVIGALLAEELFVIGAFLAEELVEFGAVEGLLDVVRTVAEFAEFEDFLEAVLGLLVGLPFSIFFASSTGDGSTSLMASLTSVMRDLCSI